MHAKSGGNLEIMGMLQGKVHQDTFIVIDVFALPVEGTETRVNAQVEAYEYMVDFGETGKVQARKSLLLHQPACICSASSAHHPILCWPPCRKWVAWKTWLVGTTAILDMGAGYQAST